MAANVHSGDKQPSLFFTELRDSDHPLKLVLLWWRDHRALWRSCADLSDADSVVIKNIEETFGDGTGKWPPVKTEDLVYWVFLFAVRFECICYQELFFTTTVTVVGLVRAR